MFDCSPEIVPGETSPTVMFWAFPDRLRPSDGATAAFGAT